MISFESGKYYRYTGKKVLLGWNNDSGNMDFCLDNKPHQCREGSGYQASFNDSRSPTNMWHWGTGIDKWEKVDMRSYKEPKIVSNKLIEYKPGSSIKDYIKKILKVEKDKTRLKWLKTFDNCVLPDDVKNMIDEALTVVLSSKIFDEWGINDHFEKGLTNSILLYGPPGTGKTMVSESIASILGKNLMKVTNADIQSNVPGRTEKNITESFEKAKKEDAVILLDECDSLLYDRNAVGAILSAEINHLLGEIENFDGTVVLTTNRLHKLDEALQRRIVAKIELPLPNKKAREQIWEKLIPPKMPTDKLNYKKLAIAELSGGDIKNAILLSARKAIARNKKKVTMEMFQEAIDGLVKNKEIYKSVKPQKFKSSTASYGDISRSMGLDKVSE